MKTTMNMKTSGTILSLLAASAVPVKSYPGEIIYSCAVNEKEWDGPYTPWAGNTKHAHAHLTFDDGPIVNSTDTILDVLKEYDTKATFFLQTNNMNEDTRYLVDRIIDEGHMIGSHTSTHRNLQYGNDTVLEEEIVHAHEFFNEYLGFQPKIFRPPFGGIDHRSHMLLEELGYTIVQWSSGCVDWWFTDNDKDLETSIAAMRFSLAEAGGIVCMHDTAQAPNDGERLRKFLDDTWNFWEYTDFLTCIDRTDVDEGVVFKTNNEYRRAVDEFRKGVTEVAHVFEEIIDVGEEEAHGAEEDVQNDAASSTPGMPAGSLFPKSSKSAKSAKSAKSSKTKSSKRHLRVNAVEN